MHTRRGLFCKERGSHSFKCHAADTISDFIYEFKNAVVDNEAMLGLIPVVHLFIGIMFLINWIANILLYLLLCWFISLFVYMNQKARNEEISFGKVFRLSIYARVIFELIETLGTTAGMGFFSGSLWMIISYLGSYYLLGMAFVKTEDKKKSE